MTIEEQIREAAYSRYCNSSSVTFGLQCDCFQDGAKWAVKMLIEKACEWIEENMCEYEDIYYDVGGFASPEFHIEEFIKDFKKAMEGGKE